MAKPAGCEREKKKTWIGLRGKRPRVTPWRIPKNVQRPAILYQYYSYFMQSVWLGVGGHPPPAFLRPGVSLWAYTRLPNSALEGKVAIYSSRGFRDPFRTLACSPEFPRSGSCIHGQQRLGLDRARW